MYLCGDTAQPQTVSLTRSPRPPAPKFLPSPPGGFRRVSVSGPPPDTAVLEACSPLGPGSSLEALAHQGLTSLRCPRPCTTPPAAPRPHVQSLPYSSAQFLIIRGHLPTKAVSTQVREARQLPGQPGRAALRVQ